MPDIIAIGSDHAGFKLKEQIKSFLKELKYKYKDFGVHTDKISSDYPDVAFKVAKYVSGGESKYGILICGTGIGMSIAANKVKGIRAALCYNKKTAELSKAHNNANILTLGARILSVNQAKEIVKEWLKTPFSKESRHIRRIKKIERMKNYGS